MCGIFAHIGSDELDLIEWINKIKHRGPDNTKTLYVDDILLGFHRLSINGIDPLSDQPMQINDIILCCNGEIYNYKNLADENNIQLRTSSDCEIIIHLYEKFGINKTCQMLDGEFSFILYDINNKELFVARDHLGLRGLFYDEKYKSFASEAKALGFCSKIEQFPPRTWWSNIDKQMHTYYHFIPKPILTQVNEIYSKIANVLTRSVEKCVVMSDRKVGFLLSGGLDSSLCTALGVRFFDHPSKVNTFSIGLKGSPDLKYAKMVADYLGTTHHSIEYTEEDFLKEIPETIKAIESYDVTTVRASNGHRLICKYIAQSTDIKVIISGEVSDELTCGYMIFGNLQPNDVEEESIRLLSEIHLYDTLRSDRSVAYNGLEGRYPFANKEFIELYLSISPSLKTFDKNRIEKYLLRKAFADKNLLPDDVLWRRKDGFSDSITGTSKPTRIIIKEFVDTQLSDLEFEENKSKYKHLTPETKEEYYYRKIFENYYSNRDNLIQKHWRPNPKFTGGKVIIEPSGRILECFH